MTASMKVTYARETLPNPLLVLRRAGYAAFRDPVTREESFVLRLTSEFYPRFHVYVEDAPGGDVVVSLHLDQRKPSYGAGAAHGGEYKGEAVEREMRRLDGWVRQVLREEEVTVAQPKSKPWWWPF